MEKKRHCVSFSQFAGYSQDILGTPRYEVSFLCGIDQRSDSAVCFSNIPVQRSKVSKIKAEVKV